MARQNRPRRSPYVFAAARIWRLGLDERLSIEHAVAVKEASSRSHNFLEPQIERAIEVPEVRISQVGEGTNWVTHASLSPVMARASLRTDGVIPPKTTRRSL